MPFLVDPLLPLVLSPLMLAALAAWWLRRPVWWARRPGPNPFAVDTRRAADPAVTAPGKAPWDVFQAAKVPPSLDAIVIGSGHSGLTTAVALTRAGKRVLVLEQHDVAGGGTHAFTLKGHEFESGLHYIGCQHEGSDTRFRSDQLSDGQVEWEPLHDPVETYVLRNADGSYRYVGTRAGWEGYVMSLIEQFGPAEAGNIQRYVQLVTETLQSDSALRWQLSKLAPLWLARLALKIPAVRRRLVVRHAERTLQEVLDEVTTNPQLKAALSLPYLNHACPPGDVSFVYHSYIVYHYMFGAWFPKNGPQAISRAMSPIVRRGGGAVLVQANVRAILVEGGGAGRAVGVAVSRTGREDEAPTIIRAPVVISTAPVPATLRLLQSHAGATAAFQKQYARALEKLSTTYVVLNVGFSHPLGQPIADLPKNTHFVASDLDVAGAHKRLHEGTAEQALQTGFPALFVTFGSVKQSPANGERGVGSAQVVVLCPFRWFEPWQDTHVDHRPAEYLDLKERMQAKLWEQLQEVFPQLKTYEVDLLDLSTPLTNNHYLGTVRGEFYGQYFDSDYMQPENFVLNRPQTPTQGLVLGGQAVTVHGIMGAQHSGLMAGSAVLNRCLLDDLAALYNATKPVPKQ